MSTLGGWDSDGRVIETTESREIYFGLRIGGRPSRIGSPTGLIRLRVDHTVWVPQYAGLATLNAREVPMAPIDSRPKLRAAAGLALPACERPPTAGR